MFLFEQHTTNRSFRYIDWEMFQNPDGNSCFRLFPRTAGMRAQSQQVATAESSIFFCFSSLFASVVEWKARKDTLAGRKKLWKIEGKWHHTQENINHTLVLLKYICLQAKSAHERKKKAAAAAAEEWRINPDEAICQNSKNEKN